MTPQEKVASMQQTLLLAQNLSQQVDPPVPMDLITAIVQIESDFNPTLVNLSQRAKPRGGAWGLAQVTLKTARDFAQRFGELGQKFWPKFDGSGESLKDPATNLGFALVYLSKALAKFDGDWYKAGVSYHQGAGKVQELVDTHGDKWAQHLPPLGMRYFNLLAQKKNAYQRPPGQPAPMVAAQTESVNGPLADGCGTGAGGGGLTTGQIAQTVIPDEPEEPKPEQMDFTEIDLSGDDNDGLG